MAEKAENLIKVRETLGLKWQEFADILGYNNIYSYKNIENGIVPVGPLLKKRLLTLFNVNADYLETGLGDIFIERTQEDYEQQKKILELRTKLRANARLDKIYLNKDSLDNQSEFAKYQYKELKKTFNNGVETNDLLINGNEINEMFLQFKNTLKSEFEEMQKATNNNFLSLYEVLNKQTDIIRDLESRNGRLVDSLLALMLVKPEEKEENIRVIKPESNIQEDITSKKKTQSAKF